MMEFILPEHLPDDSIVDLDFLAEPTAAITSPSSQSVRLPEELAELPPQGVPLPVLSGQHLQDRELRKRSIIQGVCWRKHLN